MREIKFRGKRIDTGEWVSGHYHEIASTMACVNRQPSTHIITYQRFCDWGFNPNLQVEIDPKTLRQYTNKQDNLGNDLYEGDIVKYVLHITHGPHEEGTAEIFWDDFSCGFAIHRTGLWSFSELSHIEKIGNIYDNPELLNNTGTQE